MLSGFLVVLEPRLSRNTGKLYAGVGRIPPYPSQHDGEESAMDEYVFGDVKDPDTNVIPSLEAAILLCGKLSSSGRRFEILYCRDAQQPISISGSEMPRIEHLGYDVATVRSEGWSIVDDISVRDWAAVFRQALNANGLLPTKADADAYLRAYRLNGDHDADFQFDIVEVMRVEAAQNALPFKGPT